MRENMNFEAEGEYEQLLGYLRRKTEARRLTSLDQVNDNRINKYLEKIDILEGPQREGDVNVAN